TRWPQTLLDRKVAAYGCSLGLAGIIEDNNWRSGQKRQKLSHEKVLIVEDEENERTGLAELVSSWGYRAETARDGVEGLEKATQWTPSIVVTDLKMPRMGGIELLERWAEESQPIAAILVPAKASIHSPVQAM